MTKNERLAIKMHGEEYRSMGRMANLSQQKIYGRYASIHGLADFDSRLHRPRENNIVVTSRSAFVSIWLEQLPSRLQKWLRPSHNEIDQLTDLFSRSLFAPFPPTHAEANGAIKTWSRLRWRLMLANVLRIKNKRGTLQE